MAGSSVATPTAAIPASNNISSSPRRSRVATTSSAASTASAGDVDLEDIGHVHVVLRIRPALVGGGGDSSSVPVRWQRTVLRPSPFRPEKEVLVQSEVQAGSSAADQARASISSMSALTSSPAPSASSKTTTYAFDRVLGESSTQAECYDVLGRKAVDRFVQGVNVTILAYGQTSSGKSYSMGTTGLESDYANIGGSAEDGYADRIGIIPRAVGDIFARVEEEARHAGPSASWECRLTFLELYNEELIDLLAPAGVASVPIQIREDKGRIIWAGLREVRVQSVDDVMRHLRAGSERRRTGETAMNADSSRSHAIFSLTLTQKRGGAIVASSSTRPASVAGYRSPTPTNISRRSSVVAAAPEMISLVSKFHFVDLAGSERLKRTNAVQERMKEGISINSGLTALGNVIQALADHKHVPYRDSKLTRLLQDSLGGNSYTIMLACVSPVEFNLSETHSTLRYGQRARSIKNRVQINATEVGWDDLEHLQTLVIKLRAELADVKASPAASADSHGGDEDVQTLRSRLEETRSELQEASVHSTRLASELERAKTAVVPADSDQPFNVLVEPIIAEYERTVSALEDEIKRLKDAWYMCNELNHQQQVDLEQKELKIVKQDEYVAELRVRIDKLLDSEKTSEEHINQLELRLKEAQDVEAASKDKFADLRKEHATLGSKHEDQATYITDLESKMTETQQRVTELQAAMTRAEHEAERRTEEIATLQERVASFDKHQIARPLLEELDKKNARLADVERELAESVERCTQLSADRENLRAQLEEHTDGNSAQLATALADLDAMTQKYQESLQELDSLSRSMEGSRLVEDEAGSETEETLADEGTPPQRIVHRRHRSAGADSGLSIKTREEDFRSGKRRRSQVVTTSQPLSEELSSSLVSPSFSAGGRSLLSPSPVFWRQSLPPAPNQRSAQSLETEIKQLQEALKRRDEEIAELESSLRDLHGVSSRQPPAVPDSDENAEDQQDTSADDEAIITPSVSPKCSPRTPLSRSPELSSAFTPSTKRHYDTLRESLAIEGDQTEEDSLRRLDHLMRSMARKEAAHKEHVETLAVKIGALQHENERLQATVVEPQATGEIGAQTSPSESRDRAVETSFPSTRDTGCEPMDIAPIDDGSIARAMFDLLRTHAPGTPVNENDSAAQLVATFDSLRAENEALQLKIKQAESRPTLPRARSGTESMASFRAGMQIVAEASPEQFSRSDPSSPVTRNTLARSATPTAKYPPMSPPPNMPPPPVPTALPSLPGQTESKRGSGSISACADSPVTEDDNRQAKLLVQMQEQESQIQLLRKRLEAAEQASTDVSRMTPCRETILLTTSLARRACPQTQRESECL